MKQHTVVVKVKADSLVHECRFYTSEKIAKCHPSYGVLENVKVVFPECSAICSVRSWLRLGRQFSVSPGN